MNMFTILMMSTKLATQGILKGGNFPKNFLFICFNESPFKMMKNAFYFILKAIFTLTIFLSWHFGHVEEMA